MSTESTQKTTTKEGLSDGAAILILVIIGIVLVLLLVLCAGGFYLGWKVIAAAGGIVWSWAQGIGWFLFIPFVSLSGMLGIGNPYKLLGGYACLFALLTAIDIYCIPRRRQIGPRRMFLAVTGSYAIAWIVTIIHWFLT
ncbi:MAG TPA: hypothetical protein VHA78_01095 [Candidatus Peribacteraceae bacterium]|nr:hypothetical protein [Candidatus Peribacteraceae bacterium]